MISRAIGFRKSVQPSTIGDKFVAGQLSGDGIRSRRLGNQTVELSDKVAMADVIVSLIVAGATIYAILLAVRGLNHARDSVWVAREAASISREEQVAVLLEKVSVPLSEVLRLTSELRSELIHYWGTYGRGLSVGTRFLADPVAVPAFAFADWSSIDSSTLTEEETQLLRATMTTLMPKDTSISNRERILRRSWPTEVWRTADRVGERSNRWHVTHEDVFVDAMNPAQSWNSSNISVTKNASRFLPTDSPDPLEGKDTSKVEGARDDAITALCQRHLENIAVSRHQLKLAVATLRAFAVGTEHSMVLDAHLRRLLREMRWVDQCARNLYAELSHGMTIGLPATARGLLMTSLLGSEVAGLSQSARAKSAAVWARNHASVTREADADGDRRFAVELGDYDRYYLVIDGGEIDLELRNMTGTELETASGCGLGTQFVNCFASLDPEGSAHQAFESTEDFTVFRDRAKNALVTEAQKSRFQRKLGTDTIAGLVDLWLYQSEEWLVEALGEFTAAYVAAMRNGDVRPPNILVAEQQASK